MCGSASRLVAYRYKNGYLPFTEQLIVESTMGLADKTLS
jgi:hypothetical protein